MSGKVLSGSRAQDKELFAPELANSGGLGASNVPAMAVPSFTPLK